MMQPLPPPPPPPHVEVMELTAASSAARREHQHKLLDLQAQRMASSMDVPTLPDQVRTALRDLNRPVRLFGENLANVRDRLRLELAKRKVYGDHYGSAAIPEVPSSAVSSSVAVQEETKYSRAEAALVKAREKIAVFSLQRAKDRLARERGVRAAYKALDKFKKRKAEDDPNNSDARLQAEQMDQACCKLYQSLHQASLAGSQYGDVRALSAITTHKAGVLTASWSSTLQWWDGSSPTLDLQGRQRQAHEDRIMGLDVQTTKSNNNSILAGTASIDLTAKLWTLKEADAPMTDATKAEEEEETPLQYEFQEVAHLKGHAARLCKIAFHPLGDWVATTSHDHTWRLWDIETSSAKDGGQELLLQDGHADKVFGIDFHPDGSLCAVTDYSGMIHLWDLRTGKTALHLYGHAGRVLCAKFAPTNGFQLSTAGDDGCIKVWDLRHRRKAKGNIPDSVRRTIPAHSKLIPQLEYTQDDELLVSCSFDGTAKLWSTRGDWRLLQTLEGHEGKVMGVGIVAHYEDNKPETENNQDWGIVTCGYDKTLKLWK